MARLNLPKQRIFQGPASIWKRMLAFAIDILLIDMVLFWPFENLFERIMPLDYKSLSDIRSLAGVFSSSPEMMGTVTLITISMGALAVLYFALMEYKLGQTIGKMLLNIYVISERKDEKTMTLWQALLRSIIWLPAFPFIIFWIIDPLYALLNQNSQRLLEYASKTRTVENYAGI
ncbi:hypothetical protein COV19_01115 [Candidatus Woesearchaeota archaeon CG10_big_fil_rev_8_21_14_0_10_44_13]|nr:MAG: hypothetical protein COV19_01115 [Candidatus Woesearchaeota archaeon CG10_big_fil_rev_8_21_14_0_10_44_13]